MRILIFSLAYYPLVGGAEVAVKELTDRLPDVEFDMVTMRFSKDHPKFERIGNVNVYRIGGGLGYLSKILFIPDAAAFAVSMKKKRHYDLYWALMTYMTFPVSIARLLGDRTSYVLTLQDGDPFEHVFKRWYIRLFKPLLISGFRNAAVIQTISNFLAGWARELGYKGRVEVIPNGVDTKKFSIRNFQFSKKELGFEEADKILITTSRLVEKNGVGDVISALALLPQEVKFLVLGTGPLEDQLKSQIEHLKLESRVKMLGFVDQKDIPAYLRIADIFIRPSVSEGMGNSFIEAMAAGLPVLATPVGGIPDFLKDGETGLFVGVHDPKSISIQVSRLLADDALRNTLIENGRQLAREKYDWSLIAKEMKKRVFCSTVLR